MQNVMMDETAEQTLERLNKLDDKFIDIAAYFDALRIANGFYAQLLDLHAEKAKISALKKQESDKDDWLDLDVDR